MKTSWAEFKRLVEAAGLTPHRCGHAVAHWPGTHWQIRGGAHLVNCWPCAKRGFVVQVAGQRSSLGSVKKAIKLAGPPKAPEPQTEHKYPPNVPASWEDRPVGLIRRVWRWIW